MHSDGGVRSEAEYSVGAGEGYRKKTSDGPCVFTYVPPNGVTYARGDGTLALAVNEVSSWGRVRAQGGDSGR
jgi:hypothetical protein